MSRLQWHSFKNWTISIPFAVLLILLGTVTFKLRGRYQPVKKSGIVKQEIIEISEAYDESIAKDNNYNEIVKSKIVDINSPEDIANLSVTEEQKISIAIEKANVLLKDNKPGLAYQYLAVVDNKKNKENYDYLFVYYIAARDSNRTNTISLRSQLIALMNKHSGNNSASSLPESFFSLTNKTPSGASI